MDNETEGQDGNHDFDEGGGHEVAAQLEPAVPVGIGEFIGYHFAETPMEGVDDREEIDGAVQEQENHQKGACDALDELLADGGG